MEFKNFPNSKEDMNAFLLVPDPSDKSWYFLTKMSGSKKALSIWRHKSRHCMPAGSEPLIGGRVLKDYECHDEMTRDYVGSSLFNRKVDQKWILLDVDSR